MTLTYLPLQEFHQRLADRLGRDDERPAPETLQDRNLGREPNRHLSFGLGPDFCLGASLARLEGQGAIAALLCRAGELRAAVPPGAMRWRRGLVLRGVDSLPVTVVN